MKLNRIPDGNQDRVLNRNGNVKQKPDKDQWQRSMAVMWQITAVLKDQQISIKDTPIEWECKPRMGRAAANRQSIGAP